MTISDSIDLQRTLTTLPISPALESCGVTGFEKKGNYFIITVKEKPITFSIGKEGVFKTLVNLREKTMGIIDDQITSELLSVEYQSLIEGLLYLEDKNLDKISEIEHLQAIKEDQEEDPLIHEKITKEDRDFVIDTIKKEAPYDELSIKQLLYGMLSAFTKSPIPHVVNSKDSGAGKSYLLNLVASYFPDNCVMTFASMSDKAIYHKDGIMVIENEDTGKVEPVAPILNSLNLEIKWLNEQIENEKSKENNHSINKQLIKENENKIKDIESEIKSIEKRAEKLIDLNNQIIIFQDTPQPTLYDTLMTLLSQDSSKDQKYSFVEKASSGKLWTRNNRLRGMPVLFSTQVIDDTQRTRFEEKNRRLIHVTPETSIEKIREAKRLIVIRHGSTQEEYEQLVVSKTDRERAKNIIKIWIAKLKQHSTHFQPKQSGVKIPFSRTIADSMPEGQVWDMTVAERTMKYLGIITKTNMDSRPKIVDEQTGRFYPISTFEDLKETLYLMERGASGVRPYLAKWFNEVFLPAFKELDGRPNEVKNEIGITIEKERCVGLTTVQLADKTKEIMGGPKPSSKDMLSKNLDPLVNQGIVDKTYSILDQRQNIYFPVEETINLLSVFSRKEDFKLKVTKPGMFPSRNLLKEEFRTFVNQSSEGSDILEKKSTNYRLVDSDGQEIVVDQLIDQYLSNPEECFSKTYPDNYENEKMDSYYSSTMTQTNSNSEKGNEQADATPPQKIQTVQDNFLRSTPVLKNILTGFPNNGKEDLSIQEEQDCYYKCYYCDFKTNSE